MAKTVTKGGRRRRVLVLVHPQYRPDRLAKNNAATEFDVWTTLRALGFEVEIAAADRDLRRFDRQLAAFRPDIVFNLLEEFRGEGVYDFHLVTYLESLGIPYTGCNPRGLIVTRHKLWSAQLAQALGVTAPSSRLVGPGFRPTTEFPLFLKFNREHASLGITRTNLVRTPRALAQTLKRLRHLYPGEVLAQSFVPGQEVTVSVWGNLRPQVLAPWRLGLKGQDEVSTARVKFNSQHRRRHGIRAARYRGPGAENLRSMARRLYLGLDMNGYARFDFRVNDAGQGFLIDINANPNLAKTEDFATSAKHAGFSFAQVVERLVHFGLEYRPRL